MVLAMDGPKDSLIQLQDGLSSEMMRVYRSEDRIGVGLGSCLKKHVYAIATGLSDGLGLGDNARAALLTRSMSEMVDLGVALGEVETFMGLSGFGDLIGTCMGGWSRNRTFGLELAKGINPNEVMRSQKTVVEGYWATPLVFMKNVVISQWKCLFYERFMLFFIRTRNRLLPCRI